MHVQLAAECKVLEEFLPFALHTQVCIEHRRIPERSLRKGARSYLKRLGYRVNALINATQRSVTQSSLPRV